VVEAAGVEPASEAPLDRLLRV